MAIARARLYFQTCFSRKNCFMCTSHFLDGSDGSPSCTTTCLASRSNCLLSGKLTLLCFWQFSSYLPGMYMPEAMLVTQGLLRLSSRPWLMLAPLMHIGLRISRVVVLIVFTTLVASRMTGCCWRPKKATGSLVIKLYDCRGTPTFCISFVSGMVSGGSWQMISNAGLTC